LIGVLRQLYLRETIKVKIIFFIETTLNGLDTGNVSVLVG